MENTRALGRIAGIEIRLNWSILVIVGLLAWSLAGMVLPAQVDGYSQGAYWLAGLLAASGLIGGILAHELAHAVVARRNGVGVESITLWLFGGVAQLEGEAPDPGAEARIAGVGPAVSAAIGLISGLVAISIDFLHGPALAVAALLWFALINLVLAVFNLLPGAPLDGGRLLHAFLWKRNGDRLRATVTASKAGRVLGYGLVALGVAEVLFSGRLGGLWTAFIGWFLVGAASQEASASIASDALADLSVADVMAPPPPVVPDWVGVDEFLWRYVAPGAAPYYVTEAFDGTPSGALTLDDLRRLPNAEGLRLRDVATSVEIVDPAEPVTALVRRAGGNPRRPLRALVMRAGRLVGIVTPAEVRLAIDRRRLLGRSGAKSRAG